MPTKSCKHCQTDFDVKKSEFEKRVFCSLKCKGEYQKQHLKGENNPNFRNHWSVEQRMKQSLLVKTKVDDEYRKNAGKANKGKKFSKERISAMHSNRCQESYSKTHTEKTKALIGAKSRNKFTEDYKNTHRQKMEALGYWTPIEEKSDYELYFQESNWNSSLFDILHKEFQNILEEHGIFNNKTNTKGVVRDHRLSRKTGFDLGVFPEIIRHIENCEIITHSDNVKKSRSKKRKKDSINLEELLDRIENTSYIWHEQEKCLELIKEYRNGKRWSRGKEV